MNCEEMNLELRLEMKYEVILKEYQMRLHTITQLFIQYLAKLKYHQLRCYVYFNRLLYQHCILAFNDINSVLHHLFFLIIKQRL